MVFPLVILFGIKGKETKVSSFAMISYGALRLPYSSLAKFTFHFLVSQLGRQASLPKNNSKEGRLA
jgi:hypothetical protein